MKKELDHFLIDESYGGNQEWFSDAWMKIGGCGAVTACDLCICLAKYKEMESLCPFDPDAISLEKYLEFGMQMKKYLSPRMTGIHKTSIYVDGFNEYLKDVGVHTLGLENISGDEDLATAVELVKDQIDRGFPIPYLMLLHTDKRLDDYMWHWFLLNGYDESDGTFLVSVVSYGRKKWMDLNHLWNTGKIRKGGFVRIFQRE